MPSCWPLARERADAVNPVINAIVMPLTRVADARAADPSLTGAVRGGAVPHQGPRPGVRGLPHVEWFARPGPRRRDRARPGDPPFPRGRARHLRQDQHPRVRGQGRHRARAVGAVAQPVGRHPHAGRLVGRVGRGGGGRHRARGGRQRRRGLDPDPRRLQRSGRPEDEPRHRPLRPPDRRADVRHGHPGRASRAPCATARRCSTRSSRPTRAPPTRARCRRRPFAEAIRRAPGTLRVGFSSASAINAHPDREAVTAVEHAAALLAELGHEVEEVAPPHDDEALARDFLTIWFAQLYAQVVDAASAGSAPPRATSRPTRSRPPSSGGRPASGPSSRRSATSTTTPASSARFHETHDVFLTPTLAQPPLAVGALDSPMSLQRASRTVARTRSGKLLAASGVLDQIISDNLELGALHPAREPHRPPGDQRAAALDGGRGAARRAAGRPARCRRAAAAGRRAARGGPALVPPLRRPRPRARPEAGSRASG